MSAFLTLFLAAFLFVAAPLGILAAVNALRKKQPGCSGNHDCVVYKGEKVQCPSCELREFKAQLAAAEHQA
jgi:hypothetical protein